MLYWVIMGLLVVVALGLIIAIVVALKKNSEQQEEYYYDEYDEYEEGYGEEELYEEEPQPVRARRNRREEPEERVRELERRSRGVEAERQSREQVPERRGRELEPERRSREPEPEGRGGELESQGEPQASKKKQWKVILENLDTWEKFNYIFYDNIGIGRSRADGEFEKFLTIKEDPRISKVHCVIIKKEEHLYLKDLGSRNGTYLNGQRISQPREIQRDDIIGIGETQIEVKKVLKERD